MILSDSPARFSLAKDHSDKLVEEKGDSPGCHMCWMPYLVRNFRIETEHRTFMRSGI